MPPVIKIYERRIYLTHGAGYCKLCRNEKAPTFAEAESCASPIFKAAIFVDGANLIHVVDGQAEVKHVEILRDVRLVR